MNANFQNLLNQVLEMSAEDQREFNRILVDNMRRAHKLEAMKAGRKFQIGDTVEFDAGPRKGGMVQIIVEDFSRDGSKVKGKQISGFRKGVLWTATATLCKKV